LLAVARFLLLGHDALVMLGKLKIGFLENAIAAGLGVTSILLVLFQHLLGRTADFDIRADGFEVPVGIIEIVLIIAACPAVAPA